MAVLISTGYSAKYLLAIVAKVLELFEPGTLDGYDIGSSFETTVKNSSLAPAYDAKKGRLCVNAFHGYTHCYPCQLKFHPNVIKGIELEDLETLKRIFSTTNQLATITRYASPFRRCLYIEAFLKQWDEDKYLNTGTFILNNYKQAIQIIQRNTTALQRAMASLRITDEEMDLWEREELAFFARLGQEDERNVLAITYVKLLQQLQDQDNRRAQVTFQFLNSVPEDAAASNCARHAATTRRLEAERRHAIKQYERISLEVHALEVRMGIDQGSRWTPATEEYVATLTYIHEQRYQRALDKLQKLVIQRLFELHKLNLSGTGE